MAVIVTWCGAAIAQPSAQFKLCGRFEGMGLMLKSLVATGPNPGTERLYASYAYSGNTLDIAAIDPKNGKTKIFTASPGAGTGAWAMADGGDGQIYIGTFPTARVMKVDWKQEKLIDMGSPSPSEQYIWDFTLGPDQKLYGGTYPNAKLIRFDPVTGESEDLGKMSNTEEYARSIAADDKGFIYIGVGMIKQDLVAYEIATGRHWSILPVTESTSGAPQVIAGKDGAAYVYLHKTWYKLYGGSAVVSSSPETNSLKLIDGSSIFFEGGTRITLRDKHGAVEEISVDYKGKALNIFRIGLGPDGKIYGSTMMPAHFFVADSTECALKEIGVAGSGQYYSFLAWKDRLLGAAYSGLSTVTSFIPGKQWHPGKTQRNNPWGMHFDEEDIGWRPVSMVNGADGKVYIGAIPGYGKLGGPLWMLEPESGKIKQFAHLIRNQGIYALAALSSETIVGGTTIKGGYGSKATEDAAKIFLWDTIKQEVSFEGTPVPTQGTIDALAIGKNDLVYAFAGSSIFLFDPVAKEIKHIFNLPPNMGKFIGNSVAPGPGKRIFGITTKGIFMFDEYLHAPVILAQYPGGITGGFAINGREIFFAQGSNLVSYKIPVELLEKLQ